ncbi:hypothetical protein [Pseudooctadecabacter jejudonensis]|uniref:Uncharacterized protein n=1 Tax=Pseudooctadecabacter jejudonensis TaxID=1391910 RepID=A0A1Y5S0X1_9RHOB|nr:hypothetical protein [Pseudooctadecabacter jejudonensis]SLN29569.1 hypothetical protein PSJ8397_01301 [Pseudooctadecabacter jejudonensis]
MKHLIFPFTLLLATSAAAQDYATRATDTVPTGLAALILDRPLTYFDDGTSRYNTDGTYSWDYSAANGGGTWLGHHTLDAATEDSIVCITFVTGVERCDQFVMSGDRLVLLTADGGRFPVRDIGPVEALSSE